MFIFGERRFDRAGSFNLADRTRRLQSTRDLVTRDAKPHWAEMMKMDEPNRFHYRVIGLSSRDSFSLPCSQHVSHVLSCGLSTTWKMNENEYSSFLSPSPIRHLYCILVLYQNLLPISALLAELHQKLRNCLVQLLYCTSNMIRSIWIRMMRCRQWI